MKGRITDKHRNNPIGALLNIKELLCRYQSTKPVTGNSHLLPETVEYTLSTQNEVVMTRNCMKHVLKEKKLLTVLVNVKLLLVFMLRSSGL
jgi:hypothetical protein